MIELLVEDYCQKCPCFEAVHKQMWVGYEHFIVECKNKTQCEIIYSYLFDEMKKKNEVTEE